MRGILTTNYGTHMRYYSFLSDSYFYKSFKFVIYGHIKIMEYILLLKNRTVMFRCNILVINDGTSFCSGEFQSPVAQQCCVIYIATSPVPFYS